MAGLDDWGEDTAGAAMNEGGPLSAKQFGPLNIKTVTPDEREQHVQNVVGSVQKATASERRAGARFYPRAHRDAVRTGMGVHPGYPQLGGTGAERPGHERLTSEQRHHLMEHPVEREGAARRGAGMIAALSPSQPAGMSWERNVPAAYDAMHMTADQASGIHEANQAQAGYQKTGGVLRSQAHIEGMKPTELDKAVTRSPAGFRPEAVAAVEGHHAAQEHYREVATRTRAPFDETHLKFAGVRAIQDAHDIAIGARTPEQVLPITVKTGNFYQNIADPRHSRGVTVDARSADIARGVRMGWETPRGLGAKGRYDYYKGVHQDAADRMGMTPAATQATGWIHDRNAQMNKGSAAMQKIGRSPYRAGSVID